MKYIEAIIFLIAVFLILGWGYIAYAEKVNIQVTWDVNTEKNMKEYRLYKSLSKGDYPNTPVAIIKHPTTKYTLRSNVSGKVYYFVLTAVNNRNIESGYSNQVIVDLRQPQAPKNLKVCL